PSSSSTSRIAGRRRRCSPSLPPSAPACACSRSCATPTSSRSAGPRWEIRVFKRATGALAERLLARGAEQAAGVQRYLERQLADRPWFNGAAFGWGDLSVVPYVRGIASTGTPPPAATRLAAWLERVSARPSVAAAFAAAAETMEGFEILQ